MTNPARRSYQRFTSPYLIQFWPRQAIDPIQWCLEIKSSLLSAAR
jgi:hypothetical protein